MFILKHWMSTGAKMSYVPIHTNRMLQELHIFFRSPPHTPDIKVYMDICIWCSSTLQSSWRSSSIKVFSSYLIFFSSLLSYWFWTSVYWAFGMMLNGLHGARISHCAPGNLYLNHLSYPVCSCSANLTIWFWWLTPTTVCLCLSSCLPLFWTMFFIFFLFLYVFCW